MASNVTLKNYDIADIYAHGALSVLYFVESRRKHRFRIGEICEFNQQKSTWDLQVQP